MELKVHRYELPWPSHSPRAHRSRGALIAVRNSTQYWGYADLHPWETLGDLEIEEQLSLIKKGSPTIQSEITLLAAQRDLRARENQENLIHYSPEIINHYLLLDDNELNPIFSSSLFLERDSIKPFIVKCKVSPLNFKFLINLINEESQKKRSFPLRWRLDFNSLFSYDDVINFWSQLSLKSKDLIDFIEDPCPYSRDLWNQLINKSIPLAMDLELRSLFKSKYNKTTGFSTFEVEENLLNELSTQNLIFVLKPAIQKMEFWHQWLKKNPHHFIITSYLDHPVGLLHALYWSEIFYKDFSYLMKESGLNLSLSNDYLLKYWPFLKQNFDQGNFWTNQNQIESGIGFTQKLESLSWQIL